MKEHYPDPDEPVVPVSMLRIDSADNSPSTLTNAHLGGGGGGVGARSGGGGGGGGGASTGAALSSPPTSKQSASTFNDAQHNQQEKEEGQQQQQQQHSSHPDQRDNDACGSNERECLLAPSTAVAADVSFAPEKCSRTLVDQVAPTGGPANNGTPMSTSSTIGATWMATRPTTRPFCFSPAASPGMADDNKTINPSHHPELSPSSPSAAAMRYQDPVHHDDSITETGLLSLSSSGTETKEKHDQSMMMEGIEYSTTLSSPWTTDASAAATAVICTEGQARVESEGETTMTIPAAEAAESHSGDAIRVSKTAAAESLSTPTHSAPNKGLMDNHSSLSGQEDQDMGIANTETTTVTAEESTRQEPDKAVQTTTTTEEKEPTSIHPTFAQPTVTATSGSRREGQENVPATPPPCSSSSTTSSSSSSSSSSSCSEPAVPLHGVISFNEAVYTAVHYSSELYIIPRASSGFCWNEDLFLKPYQRRALGLMDHLHQQHLQQRHHQQQSFRYGSPFQSSNNLHNASSSSSGGGGGGGQGGQGDEGESLEQSSSSSPPMSSTTPGGTFTTSTTATTAATSLQHQEMQGGRSASPYLGHDSLVTVHEIWLDDHETAGILPT